MAENRRKLQDFNLLRHHLSHTNATRATKGDPKNGKSYNLSSTFAARVVQARIHAEISQLESSDASNSSHKSAPCTLVTAIRVALLDIPMTLLFSILMVSILIQQYYNYYVLPTIDAADWMSNDAERLQHEFTYYARECDASDVSTSSVQSVKLDPEIHTAQDAVDNIMVHGLTVFPSLLDQSTAEELRDYVMKRNQELTKDEVIPISAPDNRWSFGIHANEHPSVAKALEQLSSNPMLEESLEKLLGTDPAVAEITAISVASGAEDQGWHADVKPLGNSLKYAQTFTHSYSVFIPLQDVTPEMGATAVCPGTHFCADEDLDELCEMHGFQAAGHEPEEIWKMGDGLTMDQKMWHHGAAYTAKTGPHRVVFIITFISRPNYGIDRRQLSHGTYFHIHPHMYGHTFNDLKNASVSMSWPFAPLRSLGLWKPPKANWGWDWVTTSAMRIANDQNGYQIRDMYEFVDDHSIVEMIPTWLQGSVTEDGGWQVYIKETIDNFVFCGMLIYGVVLLLVTTMVLALDACEGFKQGRTWRILLRFALLNAAVLILSHQAVVKVRSTPYAKSVDERTMFASPFVHKPEGPNAKLSEYALNACLMEFNATAPPKPTTHPDKNDILLGNRYDSKNIGHYTNFLDYHPGNREWIKVLSLYSRFYKDYSGLPPVFQQQIKSASKHHIGSNGRMLTQNYFGEWTIMDQYDVQKTVDRRLAMGVDTLSSTLYKSIAIEAADARHGPQQSGTLVMLLKTLDNLERWKEIIAPSSTAAPPTQFKKPNMPQSLLRTSLSTKNNIPNTFRKCLKETTNELHVGESTDSDAKVGDLVLVNYRGSGNYLPARIIYIEFKNYGVVEFNIGEGQFLHGGGERSDAYLKKSKPLTSVKGGDLVAITDSKCDLCPIEFELGSVIKCYPDMFCDIHFDRGGVEGVHKDAISLRFEN
jgi:hypothetical protein